MDLIQTGIDILNLPDIEWLWNGYIPRGFVTLLVGDPGVGKSAVALDLVKRLTEETEWPDGTPIPSNPTKPKALWIDAEGAKVILKERILKWGINPENIILPKQNDLFKDFNIDPVSSNQVHQILSSYKPSLTIVDSLSGVHYGEENDRRQMKVVLKHFHDWASRHNTAVLVIHHPNKQSQMNFSNKVTISRVRGSGQITAMVRSALAIENISGTFPNPDSETKIMSQLVQIKSNMGRLKENPIPFSINENGVKYFETYPDGFLPKIKSSQEEKAQQLIIKILKENDGEILAKDMEEKLKESGLSEATWKRGKKDLPIKSIRKKDQWFWKMDP